MTTAASADILIVDDTPANLNVLSTILGRQGYRVRPAINGDLALKAAQKASPDLILLDIQMPGMNGYEVCRRLKDDERTAGVPVIFISALEDALDKVEAFQIGGVDYITKPFQIEEVLVRVENQLMLRRQRAALETLSRLKTDITRVVASDLQPQIDTILDEVRQLIATSAAQAQEPHAAERLRQVSLLAQAAKTAIAELLRLAKE